MFVRAAIMIAAIAGGPAIAQIQSGISGINAPGAGTGNFGESVRLAPNGADPKEWKQRRLDRIKAILAANPGAEGTLQAMTDPQQKAAYLRKLDRATPGYGGRHY